MKQEYSFTPPQPTTKIITLFFFFGFLHPKAKPEVSLFVCVQLMCSVT